MKVLRAESLDVLSHLQDLSVKVYEPVTLDSLGPDSKKALSQDQLNVLKQNGVYFLLENPSEKEEISYLSENVVYIGKAGGKGEKILHRCRKHFNSLVDLRTANGVPRERPGKGLIQIRERRDKSVEGIFLCPVLIFTGGRQVTLEHHPYLISLVEELLLYMYCQRNGGKLPEGNVKS